MSKKGIIYLVLFLLSFGNVSLSQNTNPFEIKNRQKAQKEVIKTNHEENKAFDIKTKKIQDQSGEENPFEVNKKKIRSKSENLTAQNDRKNKNKIEIPDRILSNQNEDSSFLLWIFLFAMVYIALLLSVNRALTLKIIKTTWFYNLTNILFRNFISREYVYYLFLFINFVLNLSIFVYLYVNKQYNLSGINIFVIIFFAVLSIYFFKHFFIYVFESIFPILKSLLIYNFTVLLFNITLGIFLLPLNLIIAYSFDFLSNFFLYFSAVIIVINYILRLFRGFLITYNYFNNNIIHFFLYLCAFEILPLFVLYKIIVDIL